MAQWILKANGRVIPRHSVRPLHPGELTSPSEQSKHQSFDALIERRFGTSINPLQQLLNDGDGNSGDFENFEPYEDDDEAIRPEPEIEDTIDANGRLLNQSPAYDCMINAEVRMQLDDAAVGGRVKRRALGPDGQMTGKYDTNPTTTQSYMRLNLMMGKCMNTQRMSLPRVCLHRSTRMGSH